MARENSEEHIDRVLAKISKKSAQGEYFNNPISEGEIFSEMAFGKVPQLSKFKFLVAYGDPAPGEGKGKKASRSRRYHSSASSPASCTS